MCEALQFATHALHKKMVLVVRSQRLCQKYHRYTFVVKLLGHHRRLRHRAANPSSGYGVDPTQFKTKLLCHWLPRRHHAYQLLREDGYTLRKRDVLIVIRVHKVHKCVNLCFVLAGVDGRDKAAELR